MRIPFLEEVEFDFQQVKRRLCAWVTASISSQPRTATGDFRATITVLFARQSFAQIPRILVRCRASLQPTSEIHILPIKRPTRARQRPSVIRPETGANIA